MKLNNLVRINETALLADAVNFDMIADQEKNLKLCQGFVFNYDQKNLKSSTVGVLDAVRRSYHSQNEPNVHLLVQDYGKGKSHFGLVLANFFKQPYESKEVQGTLEQIRLATSEYPAILADLQAYKQRNPKHLVICLSGDRGDLKQNFLRSLRQTLETEGVSGSIAQRFCSEPLQFLERLDTEQLAIAEKYLKKIDNPYGDIESMIELLRHDNYHVIPTVIDISRQFTIGGYAINFEANLDLEDILEDLLKKLCSGKNPQFAGILILLDELNAYLQNWASNPATAGGMALQNITNFCENHKGRIALISFTQIKPSNAAAVPRNFKEIESYKKLISRLELSRSTYEPVSSLELVFSKLIVQENPTVWEEFRDRWNSTLLDESRTACEKRITFYREGKRDFKKFHHDFASKCFPLHPLTAYLLCNLDFTQGRTAIQFVKYDVRNFIQNEPVEIEGKLNYIRPVVLVDAFIDNFSNHSKYTDYKKAFDSVIGAASSEEITLLKAIFLFYISGSKLTKPDGEKHEEILSVLTGLSEMKVKIALDQLCNNRRAIYKLANNTYSFYSGFSILDLEQEIDKELAEDKYYNRKKPTIDQVLIYCREHLEEYFKATTITAMEFVDQNKLISDEWQFEYKIYSINGFQKALLRDKTLQETPAKGIFAYVLAETETELKPLRDEIDQLLIESSIRSQISVAIPQQGAMDIAHLLLKRDKLNEKTSAQKQNYGEAFSQFTEQIQQQIDQGLKKIFDNCTYHSYGSQKLPLADRKKPERLVSALLQELYSLVPPVEKIDKIALKSSSGTKILGFVAKQLLLDTLSENLPGKEYNNLIDPIFVSAWGLLKKTSKKYLVQEPNNQKVRSAWDEISKMTKLGSKYEEKSVYIATIWDKLSSPPYGYNEFTFTILFTAWLAYHRNEIYLRGRFGIAQNKTEQISIQIKPINDWANTNILDKPKEFVNKWILTTKPELIRRQPSPYPEIPDSVDFDSAEKYIDQIDVFLKLGNTDSQKISEIKEKQKQLQDGIKKIDTWFKSIKKAETLDPNSGIAELVNIYRSLGQPPAIVLISGTINVTPSQQQRDRQSKALEMVMGKIELIINQLTQRAKFLNTEKDCGAYEVELKQYLEYIKKIPNLAYLIEKLNDSQKVVHQRIEELRKLQDNANISQPISQVSQGKVRTNPSHYNPDNQKIQEESEEKKKENRANQIIELFDKLPPEEKLSVYELLKEYLPN